MSSRSIAGIMAVSAALIPLACPAAGSIPSDVTPSVRVDTTAEPVKPGRFEPTWNSLKQYEAPEWFRDAKFGIWAHWGPQCQPEAGDWYARHMYAQGHGQNKAHISKYGHPSEFGFKDVIHDWKAEKWNPERLVKLYKDAGAKYFFAMANHHDNLDMWASKHHEWNSVRVGPKKDIIAGWAKAARNNRLPFGVSVHAAHAWSWYELSQGSDRDGDKAGVPYDGKLTKADGKGKWWEGLDPQELYAQNHEPSSNFQNVGSVHARWNWSGGVSQPDQDYCQRFYDRTIDLINRYQPDMIYFDDTALPLWPVTDAGLHIAAHFYNTNLAKRGRKDNGVLFGKIPTDDQLECFTWDIERGVPNKTLPYAWQTCTCIGGWHYNSYEYNHNRYKSAKTVIHMLADIVSKNGNLLLNIPVRGDGSIDEKEEKIVEGIAAWMKVNSNAIYATRPWRTFGEGPASEGAELSHQGFNEGKSKPFTSEDVRYTVSKNGKTLYAIVMGVPDKPLRLTALGRSSGKENVRSVELIGGKGISSWERHDDALVIQPPRNKPDTSDAIVYKISL